MSSDKSQKKSVKSSTIHTIAPDTSISYNIEEDNTNLFLFLIIIKNVKLYIYIYINKCIHFNRYGYINIYIIIY